MHHNGKHQVDETAKKAQERLNRILAQVRAKGKDLFDQSMRNARRAIEARAELVREKAGEMSEKSVGELSEDLKSYIRANPYRAMGYAVGLGVLLGIIFRPRPVRE